MLKTKHVFVLVASFSLGCSSLATGTELIANFDNFSEGVLGTQFFDGGIRFSDLVVEAQGGIPRFVAEDATRTSWPHFSPPNYLSTFGFSPGPGAGLTQFRSFRITPPNDATAASLDLFLDIGIRELLGSTVTLTAFFHNAEVAATSVVSGQGTVIQQGFAEYHSLSVSGVRFDSLMLSATDKMGSPSYVLAATDNVRITRVPEPSSLILSLCGILIVRLHRQGFVARARHRQVA